MTPNDDRIDLEALDPEADPARLDRVVTHVLGRLGPGIVPDEPSMVDEMSLVVVRHARLVCAAAGLVAVLSAALLTVNRTPRGDPRGAPAPSEVLELPREWGVWLSTGQAPPMEDLLLRFSGEAP